MNTPIHPYVAEMRQRALKRCYTLYEMASDMRIYSDIDAEHQLRVIAGRIMKQFNITEAELLTGKIE